MGEDELLAEGVGVGTVGGGGIALATPDTDEGEQGQQTVVQARALAQVGRVLCDGEVAEGGDVAVRGVLRLFGGAGVGKTVLIQERATASLPSMEGVSGESLMASSIRNAGGTSGSP